MDAITLLEKDHRKVERLFDRYRGAPEEKRKQKLLGEITLELSRHMAAEEKEIYPILRDAIENGPALMNDALHEHQQARALLADLAGSVAGSFDMDAKVATLRQAIAHHVSDEEGEIFPKMRQALDRRRLAALGARIERAKQSSPTSPSRSAAARSPGPTMRGVVAAASDRVTGFLSPPERKPARAKSRGAKNRATAVKTTTVRTNAGRKRAAAHK